MKIVVPAIGSRGDVQPYINLCRALDAAGHEALPAVNPVHRALVEEHGVHCAPIGRPLDLGREAAVIAARAGGNWMKGLLADSEARPPPGARAGRPS